MSQGSLTRKAAKLSRLLGSRNYRRALRRGVAAAIEHEDLLSRVTLGTVVDIGANKGQFSLVAHETSPDASIIAFEPIPAAADQFRWVFDDLPKVKLHEFAIGESSTTAMLHISERQDSSSLLPIGEMQQTVFPGTGESGTLEIQVRRLNEFLEADEIGPKALLKLDVQGYELQALQGCEELLHLFNYIYVECSYMELYEGQALAQDVIDYLAGQGFHEAEQINMIRTDDGKAVQADLWFERNASGS